MTEVPVIQETKGMYMVSRAPAVKTLIGDYQYIPTRIFKKHSACFSTPREGVEWLIERARENVEATRAQWDKAQSQVNSLVAMLGGM